jgi:hypothetical protein
MWKMDRDYRAKTSGEPFCLYNDELGVVKIHHQPAAAPTSRIITTARLSANSTQQYDDQACGKHRREDGGC